MGPPFWINQRKFQFNTTGSHSTQSHRIKMTLGWSELFQTMVLWISPNGGMVDHRNHLKHNTGAAWKLWAFLILNMVQRGHKRLKANVTSRLCFLMPKKHHYKQSQWQTLGGKMSVTKQYPQEYRRNLPCSGEIHFSFWNRKEQQ